MKKDYIVHARIFKALSDENRLRILDLLKEKERNASELLHAMDFGQSTLSHHMKLLLNAEVIVSRKQGKWVIYSINDQAIGRINEWMKNYL